MANTPEQELADIARRVRGLIPDACEGIFNFNFIAKGQELFQNLSDSGKFPWRDKVRVDKQGLWPWVHYVRAWREPVDLSAPDLFPQLQFGFVSNGGTFNTSPSFRLFDALEAFTLGAPKFQDAYVPFGQAVPNTSGQPWEFFVRNERIGTQEVPSPPYTIRVEVVWSWQPSVRFRG